MTPGPSFVLQATRELYSIQHHSDIGLAATAALLTAHQSAQVVDQQAVVQLSAYLEVRNHPLVLGCGHPKSRS